MLQLRIIGVTSDLGADHLFLGIIDPAIGLGRRNQCPKDRVTVVFDFRAGQQVYSARCLLRCRGLAALPGLIRLKCHHSQRRQRGVVGATA
ncbi:hypothetical protein D3C84_973330 [compost metagenome]